MSCALSLESGGDVNQIFKKIIHKAMIMSRISNFVTHNKINALMLKSRRIITECMEKISRMALLTEGGDSSVDYKTELQNLSSKI